MTIKDFINLTRYSYRHVFCMIKRGDLKVKKELGRLIILEDSNIAKLKSFSKAIRVKEAAKIMGYTTAGIIALVNSGKLDGVKIGKRGRLFIDYFSIPTRLRMEFEKKARGEEEDKVQTIINTLAFVKTDDETKELMLLDLYRLLKKRFGTDDGTKELMLLDLYKLLKKRFGKL